MADVSDRSPGISFVTLLSYDYRYALEAIRPYYEIADEILLGLDADRISWSHKPFEIDMKEVNEEIKKLDAGGKVRVLEGNFHAADQPMVNDTRERSELSLQCTAGNWIVQIDADEVLINPREFRAWLIESDPTKLVRGRWFSVFKSFGDRALVIHPPSEIPPVATRLRGEYSESRQTKQTDVASPLKMLHFSYGRCPDEVRQKLNNWSHSRDFDTEAFFKFWESLTLDNFRQFQNFHPINPPLWPGLAVVKKGRKTEPGEWVLLEP